MQQVVRTFATGIAVFLQSYVSAHSHSNRMAARQRRVFLPRENPLQGLNDAKIRKVYRFSRRGVEYIKNLLRDDL